MKLSRQDFFSDDLRNTHWLGEVINNTDPENLGRIKVSVFGKFDLLKEEHIPWARPSFFSAGSNSGSGSFSVPKVGAIVNIEFNMGNIYHPIYTYHQKPSDELIEEIGEDHQNFQSLIYDTQLAGEESGETDHLKIFYSTNEEKGLIINLRDTVINIRNDNEIKVTNPNEDEITLKNDGTLEVTTSTSITINTLETTINTDDLITINTKEAVVNASDKAEVNTNEVIVNADTKAEVNTKTVDLNADSVNLGKSAAEAIVKGDSFMAYFNTHTHIGNLGSSSGPPINPMIKTLLSNVSKTK